MVNDKNDDPISQKPTRRDALRTATVIAGSTVLPVNIAPVQESASWLQAEYVQGVTPKDLLAQLYRNLSNDYGFTPDLADSVRVIRKRALDVRSASESLLHVGDIPDDVRTLTQRALDQANDLSFASEGKTGRMAGLSGRLQQQFSELVTEFDRYFPWLRGETLRFMEKCRAHNEAPHVRKNAQDSGNVKDRHSKPDRSDPSTPRESNISADSRATYDAIKNAIEAENMPIAHSDKNKGLNAAAGHLHAELLRMKNQESREK